MNNRIHSTVRNTRRILLTVCASLAATAGAIPPVDLGTAGSFTILTKAGVTTTGTTAITGHVGVSPIAATAMTGFGLILDSSGQFSTSTLVTGRVYAASYAAPTPAVLTMAIGDMESAYRDAAGRTSPTETELGTGELGGLTIPPGLYSWTTPVTISSNVTLDGGPNDVWIFQLSQTLIAASGVQVVLTGGAQASNVFWQVAGATTLGTTSVFKGNILAATSIAFMTGASSDGRALAQTAVTLDANAISAPVAMSPPGVRPGKGKGGKPRPDKKAHSDNRDHDRNGKGGKR